MSGNAPPKLWEWPIIALVLLYQYAKDKVVSAWRSLTGGRHNG
jgi:hypothetical protein